MRDKFTQLVDDLLERKLSPLNLQQAYRSYIRQRKNLPEDIKDLLCGRSESDSGLIASQFHMISQMIGNMELAYLRGKQENAPTNS